MIQIRSLDGSMVTQEDINLLRLDIFKNGHRYHEKVHAPYKELGFRERFTTVVWEHESEHFEMACWFGVVYQERKIGVDHTAQGRVRVAKVLLKTVLQQD